ncbi:MAG: hypothetical protein PHI40_04265, partial [Caldisericia bacterium]|nr:hypothetical protein [Caldisericia bacterium]
MISSERPLVQTISDKMQSGYRYVLTEPEGQHFDPLFQPDLTPKQMLFLGIFGGRYMTDCIHEYPSSWFENAKLCSKQHDPRLNYFLVNASQPLRYWQEKGWIYHED